MIQDSRSLSGKGKCQVERDFLFAKIDNIHLDPNDKYTLWAISENCIKFLNKYKNMSWSQQLDNVSKKLAEVLSIAIFS